LGEDIAPCRYRLEGGFVSTSEQRSDAIASPNWILGSLFAGVAVGILFGLESTLKIGIATGIGLASILIAIGLAAEKIVTGSQLRSGQAGDTSSGP